MSSKIASTMKTGNQQATVDSVRNAFDHASRMMKEAGYGLTSKVRLVVDPKLPFMGYTFFDGENYRIVVSGMAVESGLLEGLLVHEMSHVYRMERNHPSHNGPLIEESIDKLLAKITVHQDYQQKIAHDLVNHIQDLYADDIAFKVLKKTPIFKSGQLTDFLQSWVKNELEMSEDKKRDRWVNSAILVNNARALGQMERQQVEDTGGRAAMANKRFLSSMPPESISQFDYFRKLLAGLREEMTGAEYRRLLADYLNSFLEMVEKLARG